MHAARPSPREPQGKDSTRTARAQVSPTLTQTLQPPARSPRGPRGQHPGRPERTAFPSPAVCPLRPTGPKSGPLLPLSPSPQSWRPKPAPGCPEPGASRGPARPGAASPACASAPAQRLARRSSGTASGQVGARARGRRRHVCYGH